MRPFPSCFDTLNVWKRSKASLLIFAACSCTALNAGNARAVLVFEFIQQGGDVAMNISGSLSGIGPGGTTGTTVGGVDPSAGIIGGRNIVPGKSYSISGPVNFGTGGHRGFSSYTGDSVTLWTSLPQLYIDPSYIEGNSITGSAIISATTLGGMGLNSTSGLLGTWAIGADTIEVWAGPKLSASPATAPGPLPLLGAGAAFSFSRRLRSRLRAGSASPQA